MTAEPEAGSTVAVYTAPAPLAASAAPSAREWDLICRQADVVSRSGIVPKSYQTLWAPDGRLLQDRRPNCVVAALFGRVYGWDMLTAMRNVHVIEGAASLKPEAMLAMIRARGHRVSITVGADSATVHGVRADTGDELTRSFSFADAVRASLCSIGEDGMPRARSKNGEKLPWEQYPLDMCQWRAVSAVARALFGDVVLGAGYTPEELGALVEQDGSVVGASDGAYVVQVDTPAPASAPQADVDQDEPGIAAEAAQERRQDTQEPTPTPEPSDSTVTPPDATQRPPAAAQAPATLEEAVQRYRDSRDAVNRQRTGPADRVAMARAWDALLACRPEWTPQERQQESLAELERIGVDPINATVANWTSLAEMWEAEREQQIRNRWKADHGE